MTQTWAYSYDDNQLTETTQTTSFDHCTLLSLTDPIALTYTKNIEGEGKTESQLNLLGGVINVTLFYKDDTCYSELQHQYTIRYT